MIKKIIVFALVICNVVSYSQNKLDINLIQLKKSIIFNQIKLNSLQISPLVITLKNQNYNYYSFNIYSRNKCNNSFNTIHYVPIIKNNSMVWNKLNPYNTPNSKEDFIIGGLYHILSFIINNKCKIDNKCK